MATVDSIAQGIEETSAFYIHADGDEVTILKSKAAIARSICFKIETVPCISTVDACRLTAVIDGAGAFSGVQKQCWKQSIIAKHGRDAVSGTRVARKAPQTLEFVESYHSEDAWSFWEDKSNPMSAKVMRMVTDSHAFGLTNCSEQTVRVLASALLLAIGMEFASA